MPLLFVKRWVRFLNESSPVFYWFLNGRLFAEGPPKVIDFLSGAVPLNADVLLSEWSSLQLFVSINEAY